MSFYPKRRRKPEIIIVSLIDIFAILLIFMLMTTTFKKDNQPQVTIKLPESKSAVAAEAESEPVLLTIAENEEIFLGSQKVALSELKPAIEQMMRAEPKPRLALNADKKAPFGTVIAVLDALKEAGIKGNLAAFTEAKK